MNRNVLNSELCSLPRAQAHKEGAVPDFKQGGGGHFIVSFFFFFLKLYQLICVHFQGMLSLRKRSAMLACAETFVYDGRLLFQTKEKICASIGGNEDMWFIKHLPKVSSGILLTGSCGNYRAFL